MKFECDLLLDANAQAQRMRHCDKITLSLASTLNLDGSPIDHHQWSTNSLKDDPTLANEHEHAMHSRIFDA